MGKNLLVAQSGGPSAVINASLAGVIAEAMRSTQIEKVYGAVHGIQGLLDEQIIRLDTQFSTAWDFTRLSSTPSSALGSCRYKMPSPEKGPEQYARILEIFKKLDIGHFLYIGGNDSMDTAHKLAEYFAAAGEDIRAIGVPKTIDNDLPVTDHCPGFGTAAKYIATTVQEIVRDAVVYPAPSVTIVEIMGRNAGWLTAAAMLPRRLGSGAPDLVYLPETPFDPQGFMADLRRVMAERSSVVVAVSEGVKLADGTYVAEDVQSGGVDAFGHKLLAGVGRYLERMVTAELGCKVRVAELSIMQRASSHLGSLADVTEARLVGTQAVRAALAGQTGVMMALIRVSDNPYLVDVRPVPLGEVANVEKKFPLEWVDATGNMLTEAGYSYMLPLIAGEVQLPMKDGMPWHFEFDRSVKAL